MLCLWSKKLAPISQPVGSKTKTTRDFNFWLVHFVICFCCDCVYDTFDNRCIRLICHPLRNSKADISRRLAFRQSETRDYTISGNMVPNVKNANNKCGKPRGSKPVFHCNVTVKKIFCCTNNYLNKLPVIFVLVPRVIHTIPCELLRPLAPFGA